MYPCIRCAIGWCKKTKKLVMNFVLAFEPGFIIKQYEGFFLCDMYV